MENPIRSTKYYLSIFKAKISFSLTIVIQKKFTCSKYITAKTSWTKNENDAL